jgi:small subunit ribosomal protein S10
MLKKKNNQLKIIVYGYDVVTTEETTRLVAEKLSQLKVNFSKPIPLPTEKKRVTLPISPHKHKDAQEQFERRVHRRTMSVFDISPSDLENLAKLNFPNTTHLRLKTSF